MVESKYKNLSPQEFIKRLFDDTKDGCMQITYYGTLDYWDVHFNVAWGEKEYQEILEKYNKLSEKLYYFGKMHDRLIDENERKSLLSKDDFKLWETYVKPFKSFEVEEDVIEELYFRGEFDQLSDEENELLDKHFNLRNEEGLSRLPMGGELPYHLIYAAQRYENFARYNGNNDAMNYAGRDLAEKMILYYYSEGYGEEKCN